MNECYKCKYRGDLPGNTHSCCRYPGNETGMFDFFSEENSKNIEKLNVKADSYGVRNGWFMWPINFDPIWLINCDGFTLRLGSDKEE